jgi:uncharacterized membrane protein YoaK (UPF0700 family)
MAGCDASNVCTSMPAIHPQQRIAAKSVVALLLTFAAGLVDIAGYITIYHFFTANLTGDTVHLGNKLAAGNWGDASKAASIIVGFLFGSVLGRIVIEAGGRKRMRHVASITLFAEAALLIVFIQLSLLMGAPAALRAAPLAVICGFLSLLATAMGLQAATLTRVGALTIHTTFVTGMLNKFAQAFSRWLFWMHDEWRSGASLANTLRRSGKHPAFRESRFMLAIWIFYSGGAVIGTLLLPHWHTRIFYLPVLLVFIAISVDQFHPLSVEEEHDQI